MWTAVGSLGSVRQVQLPRLLSMSELDFRAKPVFQKVKTWD